MVALTSLPQPETEPISGLKAQMADQIKKLVHYLKPHDPTNMKQIDYAETDLYLAKLTARPSMQKRAARTHGYRCSADKRLEREFLKSCAGLAKVTQASRRGRE
jgi:hypothetical protein